MSDSSENHSLHKAGDLLVTMQGTNVADMEKDPSVRFKTLEELDSCSPSLTRIGGLLTQRVGVLCSQTNGHLRATDPGYRNRCQSQ